METKEIERRFLEGVQNARGFRRWVVLFVAERPNTTAGYLIITGAYFLYRAAAWMVSSLLSAVF